MMPEARTAAQAALAAHQSAPAEVVEYSSRGRVLLIAPPARESEAINICAALPTPPTVWIAADLDAPPRETIGKVRVVRGAARALDGHLGAFAPRAAGCFAKDEIFDAVADCDSPPLFRRLNPARILPPPGYIAAADIKAALLDAAALSGVFQKPRYFAYNASICAHGGGRGCSRCVAACPAQAISAADGKIAIDPALCQGCATCALTCPSGAIRHVYPPPRDVLGALRGALRAWREAGDSAAPVTVFYRQAAAPPPDLPPRCLPIAVEEIAAVGIEAWFALLAWGAGGVALMIDDASESATRSVLAEQTAIARAILNALGVPPAVLQSAGADSIAAAVGRIPPLPPPPQAATFAPSDDKREVFFAALDYLARANSIVSLPAGAPFGEVRVDSEKCTLCLACAGACPTAALRAGGETPRLAFVEHNCVQCGLCENICPEEAIALSPRLLTDAAARGAPRILAEEAPFCCVACGRPFAAAAALARVERRLAAHPMFQDDAARRQLRLCADCRVKAMFAPRAD